MKHLKGYQEFNEGKAFRGLLKSATFVGTGLKSLAHLLTLNWNSFIFTLKSLPYSSKLIDIFDTFKNKKDVFWTKDILTLYKETHGRDMINDINEVREFVINSKEKNKDTYLELVDSIKNMIEESLQEDEGFKDTLQSLKNKIIDLSNMSREKGYDSGIEYPEDWFDKPISQMDELELRKEMDKALDKKDYEKARFIGNYINKK